MSRGASQRNLSAVTHAIKDLGGEVLEYAPDRRHIRVKFKTPAGNTSWLSISKGPIDPHKLKGWTRQAMMRADVTPASNRRYRRDGRLTKGNYLQ
jgi:hypothetical protein